MKSALGKSAAMEPYYQYLVKEGYFETMKAVMLLAIMIGFKNEARIPVTKYGVDAIKAVSYTHLIFLKSFME